MYSFRAKKVMMLSDPKHWDHILSFMQSGEVPHRIALTDADKLRSSGELPSRSATSNSGEKVQDCQYQIELAIW